MVAAVAAAAVATRARRIVDAFLRTPFPRDAI